MIKKIIKQIKSITNLLLRSGLIVEYNDISEKDGRITWSDFKDYSFVYKDCDYELIYDKCKSDRDFNFMLHDGGIVQMMYILDREEIVKHRLLFLPAINSESDTIYEENRTINSKQVPFPIRFDYDNNNVKINHPASHLTLGNYDSCRIPVSSPITPNRFIVFLLNNFYQDYYVDKVEPIMGSTLNCDYSFETVTSIEKKNIYLNFEVHNNGFKK